MSIYAYSPKKSSIQCLHYIIIILICQFFLLRTLTILRRFDIILNVTRLNILNFRAINSVGRVLPSHGRSREFESLIAHHKKRHAERRVFFSGGRGTDKYAATCCRRSSICLKANSCRGFPLAGNGKISYRPNPKPKPPTKRRVFFNGGRLTDKYAATRCRRSSICKANSYYSKYTRYKTYFKTQPIHF